MSAASIRRQPTFSRSGYQAKASLQHWSNEMKAPHGRLLSSHQRLICASDRNAKIVLHVNATLSQNRRGGTTK
jgi:hypothetical protein